MLAAYERALLANPMITKCVTAGTIFTTASISAQSIVNWKTGANKPICFKTALRSGFFGAFIFAPLGHMFYNNLDKLVRGTAPQHVIGKIAIDQLLWTPPLTICFFSTMKVLEFYSDPTLMNMIQMEIEGKLWTSLKTGWTVWPLIHLVTFTVIPLRHRILWISTANLGWSTFWCWLSQQDVEEPKALKEEPKTLIEPLANKELAAVAS